eukprot:scaffold5342_cov104-Cylindrotheca_fusiformis.AAC.4
MTGDVRACDCTDGRTSRFARFCQGKPQQIPTRNQISIWQPTIQLHPCSPWHCHFSCHTHVVPGFLSKRAKQVMSCYWDFVQKYAGDVRCCIEREVLRKDKLFFTEKGKPGPQRGGKKCFRFEQ